MTTDKKILYTSSVLLTAVLLCISVIAGDSSRFIAAVLLIFAAFAASYLIKKRSILSVSHRTVALLMAAMAALYITLLYLSGIHFGFWRATVPFKLSSLYLYILPIAAIVVGGEVVRAVLLAQKNKTVSLLAYFIGVFGELAIFGGLGSITDFSRFMDYVGLTLFPALFANLLYNYASARYGRYPNIVYRLLLALYPYVIPYIPAVPDVLVSFVGLVLPLLAFWFLSALYEKKPRVAVRSRKKTRLARIVAVFVVLVAVMVVMLISCRFRFCALVIGSGSMSDEINKGDVVIYERYDDQVIAEGDVIVFEHYDTLVIHRVVEIQRVNNQNRYYTKGDANEDRDAGYVTDADIVGVTDFKIAFVGYPSLWMHQLFAD